MRRALGAAVLLAGLAAILGCGMLPGAAPGLDGTSWRAVSISGNAPVAGAEPTAQFEEGMIRGTTGCNSYGGRVLIEGTTLTINDLNRSMIGCPDPIASVEGTFMKVLGAARTVRFDGPNLVISGDSGEIVFRAG